MTEAIDLSPYDFVDFGCSTGGSISFAEKAFAGGAALGIDIDPLKVEQTRAAGRNAVLADATDPTQFCGQVRFSILSHFLEHLPDYPTVTQAIQTAVRISTDFVFIRQPWFDSDGELISQGMKFYWSDWTGHSMPLTTLQMYRSIRAHVSSGYAVRATIFGYRQIDNTDNECIIPISAPINSGKYEAELHGPKEGLALKAPAFQELVAIIAIKDPDAIENALAKFPGITQLRDIDRTRSGRLSDNLFQVVRA